MPRLYYQDTNETIAEITEPQLKELTDHLEEEHSEDRDYYISKETVDMLEENGLSADLVGILKKALGDRDEMDIAWSD